MSHDYKSISTIPSRRYDSLYQITSPSSKDDAMPSSYVLNEDRIVSEDAINQLERDGVVCLRGVLDSALIDDLRSESDQAVSDAGPDARFIRSVDKDSIFYYEFNLWRRYPMLRKILFESDLPDIAMSLIRSSTLTLYYTNTFVKDGGTTKVTPWHEDGSYSRFQGENVINFNVSYDYMPAETTLKFKQGSNRRTDPPYIGPTFEPGVEYAEAMPEQKQMPSQEEIDKQFRTVYWEVYPGDALVFFQRTLHAGPGNSLTTRRHSTAFNFGGNGVTYDARPGFIDSPDADPDLEHGAPPAGKIFPRLR